MTYYENTGRMICKCNSSEECELAYHRNMGKLLYMNQEDKEGIYYPGDTIKYDASIYNIYYQNENGEEELIATDGTGTYNISKDYNRFGVYYLLDQDKIEETASKFVIISKKYGAGYYRKNGSLIKRIEGDTLTYDKSIRWIEVAWIIVPASITKIESSPITNLQSYAYQMISVYGFAEVFEGRNIIACVFEADDNIKIQKADMKNMFVGTMIGTSPVVNWKQLVDRFDKDITYIDTGYIASWGDTNFDTLILNRLPEFQQLKHLCIGVLDERVRFLSKLEYLYLTSNFTDYSLLPPSIKELYGYVNPQTINELKGLTNLECIDLSLGNLISGDLISEKVRAWRAFDSKATAARVRAEEADGVLSDAYDELESLDTLALDLSQLLNNLPQNIKRLYCNIRTKDDFDAVIAKKDLELLHITFTNAITETIDIGHLLRGLKKLKYLYIYPISSHITYGNDDDALKVISDDEEPLIELEIPRGQSIFGSIEDALAIKDRTNLKLLNISDYYNEDEIIDEDEANDIFTKLSELTQLECISMNGLFYAQPNITDINLSPLGNLEKLKFLAMDGMFHKCSSLKNISFPTFKDGMQFKYISIHNMLEETFLSNITLPRFNNISCERLYIGNFVLNTIPHTINIENIIPQYTNTFYASNIASNAYKIYLGSCNITDNSLLNYAMRFLDGLANDIVILTADKKYIELLTDDSDDALCKFDVLGLGNPYIDGNGKTGELEEGVLYDFACKREEEEAGEYIFKIVSKPIKHVEKEEGEIKIYYGGETIDEYDENLYNIYNDSDRAMNWPDRLIPEDLSTHGIYQIKTNKTGPVLREFIVSPKVEGYYDISGNKIGSCLGEEGYVALELDGGHDTSEIAWIIIPADGKIEKEEQEHLYDGLVNLLACKIESTNISMLWGMFKNCVSLTSITFPELLSGNTGLNMNYMCSGCVSLERLTLPSDLSDTMVTMIEMCSKCVSLKSLTLPKLLLIPPRPLTTTTLEMTGMCIGCVSLKSLTLPELSGITDLNMSYMCRGCVSLESLTLPELSGMTELDMSYMCSGCVALTSITLPSDALSGIKTLKMNNMCSGCASLKSLSLPEVSLSSQSESTTTTLDINNMCEGCVALESLSISKLSGITILNMNRMCWWCVSLTSLTLPYELSGITTLNMSHMCNECSALGTLTLPKLSAITDLSMSCMCRGCSTLESLSIPELSLPVPSESLITTLGMANMCEKCVALKSLTLPNRGNASVTEFQTDNMFDSCEALETVYMEGFLPMETMSATYISSMFKECNALSTVYIGNNSLHVISGISRNYNLNIFQNVPTSITFHVIADRIFMLAMNFIRALTEDSLTKISGLSDDNSYKFKCSRINDQEEEYLEITDPKEYTA